MADPTTKTTAKADPTVFLEIWRTLQLVWALMLDDRVAFLPKLIVPLVALYIVSPIDIIPEALFLFVGAIDDIALLFFGAQLFIRLAPPDVVMEHRRRLSGGRDFTDDAPSSDPNTVDGTFRVVDEKK